MVFVTKYRRGDFDDEMLACCEEIMRKVCQRFEAELKEFNGELDHVRLLINYPPKVAVSKLVNSLKDVSCGGAPLAIVRQYIDHRNIRSEIARQSGLEKRFIPA
ncbi:IS200/IS605 family transposase [Streptomyces sp. NPDC058469]|uniref:IS200/IS605 family transposase n=1 Tax=Streptomyces sp. NPDC058469 TaxID=3346514 RepID=UPI00365CFC89